MLAVGMLLAAIIMVGQRHPGMDSAVYQAGASAILRGNALYDSLAIPLPWADLPFTYPPVAAIFFLPLVAFKLHIVWGIMAALCVLALGVAVRAFLRSLIDEPSPWLVNAVTLLPLGLQAVWSTIGLGQVNLILMALIAVDVLAMRGSRYSGVLIGIAASIKLTPLIFIPHLLLTGRRSDAARATATFLGLQAFAWLVLPGDSVRFWTSAIMEGNGNRTYESANQSINGLLQRLTGEAPSALTVSLILGAGCLALMAVLVRRLHDHDQPLAAMLVTAFCGLLISPVTWTHHWVWVVPLCILLGYRALRRGEVGARVLLALLLLVFSVDFRLLVRHGEKLELDWGLRETLVGNSYLWAAVIVGVTGIAWLVARQQRIAAATGPMLPIDSVPSPRQPDPSDRQLVDQRR
ncbi:membrane protein [Rhizocola hellebori]|uniref:Membrane protein n=1 Tax=Rhizocola hellebori TaxID=1392758 RepID=A0A8J3QFV0_9ACTN|nr:membrane protein [Rhizocola hellebori]